MPLFSRRHFIGKFGLGGAALITAVQFPGDTKEMFVHHVYFWLKDPGNKDDHKKLVEGLKKLSKIKTIRMFHIGKPAGTNRDVIDGSYSISWLTVFDDQAGQDSYQTDPVHLDFVKECSPLWNKVVVYDSVDL